LINFVFFWGVDLLLVADVLLRILRTRGRICKENNQNEYLKLVKKN
jgi:hypothetical protein